ncbi:MAG: ferritin-like domain-containing protein [Gammaproteobacteria bacterium]
MMQDLFELGRACLATCDPVEKVACTQQAAHLLRDAACRLDPTAAAVRVDAPGRPARPLLVHHSKLARRKLGNLEGRTAFIHALAHIEFNAINLAWDAVLRFRGLPADFYHDWVGVAAEEALHFSLLDARLHELDSEYGAFPAHDGLWEMAAKTADDVLVRMALVPRVLEARGLDVTPGMIRRLQQTGDTGTVAILERIYADEIGHVQIGSHWYRYLCRERGLKPAATFRELLADYQLERFKPPLNMLARAQAGFDPEELEMLGSMAGQDKA